MQYCIPCSLKPDFARYITVQYVPRSKHIASPIQSPVVCYNRRLFSKKNTKHIHFVDIVQISRVKKESWYIQ